MKPALVLLSDRDTDAPFLPGIATVSKDRNRPGFDHGGWQMGVNAAAVGGLWVDRPYFTGNPPADWLINECRVITQAGGYCQAGNEENLPDEGWQGGFPAWRQFWRDLNTLYPEGNWLAMPPSPGVPGWDGWVIRDAPRLAVHCYGTLQEMMDVLNWYLANTSGDLFITECNFAAGRQVDRNQWAHEHLRPFLDLCGSLTRVKFLAYFAHRWNMSHTLPTPVDAAGTEILTVLQTWQGGAMSLANVLLDEGEARRAIRFNPGAALQQAGNRDGFQIASPEYDITHEGKSYRGQLFERLGDGAVRVYYGDLINGTWGGNVRHVQRGGGSQPQQPKLIDLPTTHKEPRGGNKVEYIIVHSAVAPDDGTVDSTARYLTKNSRKVSSNEVVGDGKVYRLANDDEVTYHAEYGTLPDGTTGRALSKKTWSIEAHQRLNEPLTDADYKLLVERVAAAARRNKVPLHKVLGHGEIDPTRRSDPIMRPSMDDFRRDVGRLL